MSSVRFRTTIALAPALAASMLLSSVAAAQEISPVTPGFSVQAHGIFGTMNTPIYPQADGGRALGFGGEVTYGASPRLGIFGRLTRLSSASETLTESTEYTMLQGDVGARWMSMPGARVRPFAEAGIAMRRLAFSFTDTIPLDFSATNAGVTASVGVMLFQTDRVSLEGAGTYTSGNFSSWKVNGRREPIQQLTSETIGVRVGARYWFTK